MYQELDVEKFGLGKPVRDYESESKKHYYEFVDSCLGKDKVFRSFFVCFKTYRNHFFWEL